MRKSRAEQKQNEDDVGSEISEGSVSVHNADRDPPHSPWDATYPGMRPLDSVKGTKINGHNAAPKFHDTVAQSVLSKGLVLMWNSLAISDDAAP